MDTTADFLTILRNGYQAKKERVVVNATKTRLAITQILKDEGFVADYKVSEAKPSNKMTITLRYFDKNLPAIAGIKKVSVPSVRIYAGYDELPITLSGAGLTIVSTSAGFMTGKAAKEKHLGGEVICQIW
ncbi:MAG TPA: 30S ribosomal protein S8 [Patescibacteria group bacterium]